MPSAIRILFLLVFCASDCYSIPHNFKEGPVVSRALALLNNNQHKAAFELLDRTVRDSRATERASASFHAGRILLERQSMINHRQLALGYLSFSHKQGHHLAGLMMAQVFDQPGIINRLLSNTKPIRLSRSQLDQYRMLSGKMGKPSNTKPYMGTLRYFTEKPGPEAILLRRLAQNLKTHAPGAFDVIYSIVLDEPTASQRTSLTDDNTLVLNTEYTPDFGGTLSRRLHVDHYPAFVLSTPDKTTVFYHYEQMQQAVLSFF